MRATVSINGRLVGAGSATISVFDHGFLYGEGVYETLRTYDREPFLFEAHAARLRRSAAMLALEVPGTDAELRETVRQAVAAHAAEHAGELYIRVLLTRGVGELSYRLDACPSPTLVVLVKALPEPPARNYDDGIRVALVDIKRNHRETLNPAIKSNNLLNNALAMQQAHALGAEEAVMCNLDGFLVECAQSNLFVVRDTNVQTPPLSDGLLPGITRQFVLDLAGELGIPAGEVSMTPDDLAAAQEAFITGTTREITPVTRVGDRLVGDGRPGPVTRRLMDAFRRKTVRRSPPTAGTST